MAKIETKLFGFTRAGDPVNEYILSNPGGLSVSVLDYGAIIKNIIVPARRGPVDVVLGHDTIQEYELDTATYCGSFVGRYANRIEGAAFTLNGKTYQLEANSGRNHLHGCFARKSYAVKAFGDTLLLEADSPDGEDGFPGNMKIAVRYTLTPDNAFRMDYRVSSDADTIVNLTNHTYFNLNGGGTILDQRLKLFASTYLESNEETCPTGRILPVAGTPMDFTKGKAIGRDLDPGCEQTPTMMASPSAVAGRTIARTQLMTATRCTASIQPCSVCPVEPDVRCASKRWTYSDLKAWWWKL